MTTPSTTAAAPAGIGAALQGVSSIARSGFALVLGSLIASALGMVFWALAARLLSAEQLGIGAALISAFTTLSHASQLNLRNLLHRFVPGAGAAAPGMIRRSYAAAAVAAVVLGTSFALLAGAIAPELAFLGQSPLAIAGFTAGLVIWTLYVLQEAALTALRLAVYVPLQSLVYSAAKIACLVALVVIVPAGGTILAAWVAPALLIGVLTHFLISRSLSARPPSPSPAATIGWRQMLSFFGWDYIGALATSVSLGAVPLLLVSLSGAADVAPYYLAWSITYTLYLASRHVGAAMLAELATSTNGPRALYAETIVLTIVPVVGGVAMLLLLAPQVMLIFGPGYVDAGSDALRILALSGIPGSLVAAYLSICRAEGWGRMIALLQVVTLVAVLVLGGVLTASLGPTGMAWAWFVANSLAALLVLGSALARGGPLGALDFGIELVSAAQRLARQLKALLPVRTSAPPADATIQLAGRQWTIGGKAPSSLSDATTLRLRTADSPHRSAVLKRASTTPGKDALRREHAALLRLRQDDTAFSIVGHLLPEPIYFEDGTLMTSSLPGSDARMSSVRQAEQTPAIASVIETMSTLHRMAGSNQLPSAMWTAAWIDAPLGRIASAVGGHKNVTRMATELRQAWTNSTTRLGPGHGDMCPDNVLIERDPSTGMMRPSGLVDWGGFRPDAPAGLDACTMAMALRAGSNGRQLGQVVVDLLKRPEWTSAELEWLVRGGNQPWLVDPAALRVTILLAWLQHVDSNLGKSMRYTATGYWRLANIRLVLEGYGHVAR